MALVRALSFSFIFDGSMLNVTGSISTNTGFALQYKTALAVATQVNAGTSTSSPGPTPAASSARCSAVVQLETAIACFTPWRSAKSRSNSFTFGPCVTQPLNKGSRMACHSSSPRQGCDIWIVRFSIKFMPLPLHCASYGYAIRSGAKVPAPGYTDNENRFPFPLSRSNRSGFSPVRGRHRRCKVYT
ncbi:MAG: hypothetical protein FD123_3532 [Bacteroidetes bacterium]|nr:MAG: hypothetical protein FD123_3532 [Bacteroidota bacterium]